MDKKLSVIVPVYNTEKYVRNCIESILNQDYSPLEVILINDGSTDNSLDILKEYESDIVTVIDQPNQGVSATRRVGLNHSTGDYISFIDSDDTITSGMFKELLYQLESEKADFIAMSQNSIIPARIHSGIIDRDTALIELMNLRVPSSVWSYVFKKEIAREIYIPENIHFFEDFLFVYKAIILSNRIALTDRNYYNYESNESSINKQGINDKRMSCLDIIPLLLAPDSQIKEVIYPYVYFTIAHFLVSNIIFLDRKNENNEVYERKLQTNCKLYLGEIRKQKFIPFSYKIVISSCALFPSFTTLIMMLRRRVKE